MLSQFLARSLWLLTLCVGCTRGPSLPPTFPVTGVVTFEDTPVDGASVVLIPTDPEGRSARGITDDSGNFTVSTYFDPTHEPPGAVAGQYQIIVTKSEDVELMDESLSEEEQMQAMAKIKPPKSILPEKYAKPETSGLEVEVSPEVSEPLLLELND